MFSNRSGTSSAMLGLIVALIIAGVVLFIVLGFFSDNSNKIKDDVNELTACEEGLWKDTPGASGAQCVSSCPDSTTDTQYLSIGSQGCPNSLKCCLTIPLSRE